MTASAFLGGHLDPISCSRCGRCCHYVWKGEIRKCRFLIQIANDLTYCRIYKDRIGKILDYDPSNGNTVLCVMRSDDPRIFKNCPLNRPV